MNDGNNNVEQLFPLSEVEQQVVARWYQGDVSEAYQRGIDIAGASGRFYVVGGNYSQRKTSDIAACLKDFAERNMPNCAAARHLARELVRRRAGRYSFTPTDPNGPAAA